MSSIVRVGRVPGVLEVIYDGVITHELRESMVRRGEDLMGRFNLPVVIVDYRFATLAWKPEESQIFQTHLIRRQGVDGSLLIYVTGDEARDCLEQEAMIGNELGLMIEVVNSMDAAYALIEDLETDVQQD